MRRKVFFLTAYYVFAAIYWGAIAWVLYSTWVEVVPILRGKR